MIRLRKYRHYIWKAQGLLNNINILRQKTRVFVCFPYYLLIMLAPFHH